jgi:hypothetical protein
MHQREAMWISFQPASDPPECRSDKDVEEVFAPSAVKISGGGVNALTGLPQSESAKKGTQDYLAIGQKNAQL